MHKKTIIMVGCILLALLAAGLLFYYFSGRQETEPGLETRQQVYPIDISAPIDDITDHAEPYDQEDDVDKDIKDAEEDEKKEKYRDDVLKEGFISTLAEMIFTGYHPATAPGDSARFTTTFKMINMHFAVDLSDFEVDQQNILEARQKVLNHLLQPAVVKSAAEYYGPRLINHIIYLAQNRKKIISTLDATEERLLTTAETADMLRLFSRRMSYLAHVFEKSVNHAEVMDMVADYLQVIDNLNNVYFEYWQLDEDSPNQDREYLGTKIKSLIQQREDMRNDIISRVATADMRQEGHDYVYEAQWIYRRTVVDGFSEESVQSLADAGKMISFMALDRAEQLLDD